ncbi:ferredoxin--NADP+ reductase [Variovorax sp. PDC80]|jgi:ferredoxin--NADP+ reductase|nr:ferredoxin--NADP+ reductase [Variovorax sp. PDC80]
MEGSEPAGSWRPKGVHPGSANPPSFTTIEFRMSAFSEEKVLSVHHWTDRLFTFTTTRDPALRFSNGHFTMIGLRVNDKPLLRAYSIVSPNYEEHLEFLSIKVEDGPLTSRLQHIQVGDTIIVGRKPTGTLLIDYTLPGKRLYLFGTGTGLAPFMSVIRDPETYEKFEQVILVHGVRQVDELAYHDLVTDHLPKHEFLGEMVAKQLLYYPTVTREEFRNQGRITDLIASNKLTDDLGLPPINAAEDRVMLCGSPGLLVDLKHILEARGFKEGNTSTPGDFVVERAFAEK